MLNIQSLGKPMLVRNGRRVRLTVMKEEISKRRNRKTGGFDAVIHVFDARAVTRPSNQQNR